MFLLQDVCSRYLSRKLCCLHVAFGGLFLDISAGRHVLQMLLIKAMFYKYLYCRLQSLDFHFEVGFSRCLFQDSQVDVSTRDWVLQILFWRTCCLQIYFAGCVTCTFIVEVMFSRYVSQRLCSLDVSQRLCSLDMSPRVYVLQICLVEAR